MGDDLRLLFATHFGPSHELRQLAADIARTGMNPFRCEGKRRTKCREVDYPLNFLANGTGEGFRNPRFELPDDSRQNYTRLEEVSSQLLDWKLSFSDQAQSSPGLAFLFDPWVDTGLASHLLENEKLPAHPTVVLLSDYYPLGALWEISREMQEAFADGNDWAEAIVKDHLALATWPVQDVTARNLYRALCPEGQELATGYVTDLFVKHQLLLWNFLPMFRGGFKHSNDCGLPAGESWIRLCLDWTRRFLKAVKATNFLVLCSGWMLPSLTIPRSSDPAEYERYCLLCDRKWIGSTGHDCLEHFFGLQGENGLPPINHIFRIYQPSGWRGRGRHHAEVFQAAMRHINRSKSPLANGERLGSA
jgi:hypothetical protein